MCLLGHRSSTLPLPYAHAVVQGMPRLQSLSLSSWSLAELQLIAASLPGTTQASLPDSVERLIQELGSVGLTTELWILLASWRVT